jgi:hypothetical protein
LEDHCAIATSLGLFNTGHDLLFLHSVALEFLMTSPQATIATLPDTIVGYFDEATEVYLVAHMFPPDSVSLMPQFFESAFVFLF